MNAHSFITRAGSVSGRTHRSLGRPNQDALCCHSWDDGLAAVVCDGCGSAPESGMGAVLGSRLVAGALMRHRQLLAEATTPQDVGEYLAQVEEDVLAALRAVVAGCPEPAEHTVHECLLFTILGLAICGERTVLFGLGDGVFGCNGVIQVLGPYPDNAPPYLGYRLLSSTPASDTACTLTCHAFLPTQELAVAMIGTDGLADAMRGAAQPLPGSVEPFGPLAQFWQDDRYLRNPDLLRRRLALAARAVPGTPAILTDDTSLVVVRRVEGEAAR